METITLTYDPKSKKALQLLKELLESGFFSEKGKENSGVKISQENKSFIENSRRNASLLFSDKI